MNAPRSYRDASSFSSLISKGVKPTAKKVVIYGPEGIGKSTLAAAFPSPLFLDVEGGTKALDVDRIDDLNSWSGLISILDMLITQHGHYETIVIDTADWAEKLCAAHICAASKKSGIEDFGYGKGFTYLKEEFAKMLETCDSLIDKGLHVVFTAHAAMRKFEQPDERGSYDRWEMKLSKFDAPMLKEWADMVLFCNYRTFTQRQENGKYKVTGGERIMYTTHNPCWDAKNRYGLADELPMQYSQIAKAVDFKSCAQAPAPAPEPEPELPLICQRCGQTITAYGNHSAEAIAARSMKIFGEQLCVNCAVAAKNETQNENGGNE